MSLVLLGIALASRDIWSSTLNLIESLTNTIFFDFSTTFILHEALYFPAEHVIFAFPVLNVITFPFLSTNATSGLFDFHF